MNNIDRNNMNPSYGRERRPHSHQTQTPTVIPKDSRSYGRRRGIPQIQRTAAYLRVEAGIVPFSDEKTVPRDEGRGYKAITLHAETDLDGWRQFARSYRNTPTYPGCINEACRTRHDICIPSMVTIGCLNCLRDNRHCSLINDWLAMCLRSRLQWNTQQIQVFLGEYNSRKSAIYQEMEHSPYIASSSSIALCENVFGRHNMVAAYISMLRNTFLSVIRESLLLRRLAHLSMVLQLVKSDWNDGELSDRRKRAITNLLFLQLDRRALLAEGSLSQQRIPLLQ
ncbi:hypothetical protein BKA70DRAFT_1214450 [Coprinopsis sp. MPI-PUGE-AT-0042]|nr:hypothetical protein BKA70DRAFT_1214450 [Coprinopsis sp. MPI-PUGE-AT-0042]